MQKFSTQPSDKGGYEVIRWNEVLQKWEVRERFITEEDAKRRADELNKEIGQE